MTARIAALTACLVLAGCTQDGSTAAGPPDNPPTSSPRPARSPRATPPDIATDFDPRQVRLRLDTVAQGFEAPLVVTSAGDGSGRLFVAEQGGRIFEIGAEGARPAPFLDLSDLTEASGEQGLLGLAFHPAYEDNGRLFINYTDTAGDTVIAEYRARRRHQADLGSGRTVLSFDQPFPNHNGGGLAFGPDGYLYIATGDGGSAGDPQGNGQALDTLLGKLLRIDVDARNNESGYAVPANNPFVDRAEARPEIWAYGLRNPWRFGFDRATNRVWIGDVGQSNLEEINRVSLRGGRGANFGWSILEGTSCYAATDCRRAGLEPPVTQYDHGDGCSVTGGYVYRGSAHPELAGGYFFGDFCSGKVWALDAGVQNLTRPIELLDTDHAISSFGEGEDGELFLTDHASGRVLRLVATP
jgi:glucose/arabinose dehydrogenase